ncbi:MAG: c-type cytochrome [Chlorobi bacterium]|nr:c-type cytochrome [Chlorobiota bacterium]MCI0715166.1 c-type cytochrome [Chlorobiota bacterium]
MKTIKKIFTLFSLIIINDMQFAQTAADDSSMNEYSQLAGAAVFLLVAFLFILFFILSTPKYKYSYERRRERFSFLTKLSRVLNRAVPVEKEKDIMMDHEYDGIRELNNTIPPWFNVLFYGTVLFAAIYLLDYHVFGSGNIMVDEFVEEIRIAEEKKQELIKTGAFINEENVILLTDVPSLDAGKQIFTINCVPCHGPDAGGTVGPNLTDQYWIHGGGIKNVFKTIKEGVPVKGMISWKTMLNPKQMQQVGSYVLSLQGTKPPAGKQPEGNVWVDTTTAKIDTIKVKIDSVKSKTDSIKTKTDSNIN